MITVILFGVMHPKPCLQRLDVLLNRAGRTILKVPSRTSASVVRNELGWKALEERRAVHINTMVFKCLTGTVPSYLSSVFVPVSELHRHQTRNSTVG